MVTLLMTAANYVQSCVWLYLVTAIILKYLFAFCFSQIIFLFYDFSSLNLPPSNALMKMA